MNKLVIFNVGGALSCYAEFNDNKVVIDLGSGAGFSPTRDFLIPLSYKKEFSRGVDVHRRNRFMVDQLFLSHLDRDHISDYIQFRGDFSGHFMTCPNDNSQQLNIFKVKREYLGVESESRGIVLDDMRLRTTSDNFYPLLSSENPLLSIIDEISLFYINPYICETSELISGYANNISLILFLKVDDKTVLLPGDILKEGMSYLINNVPEFKDLLEIDGVDYLVAPHHGLQTSFSEELFQTMKDGKTRLNIISEKVRTADSNESRSNVDTRYFNSDYSTGLNSLGRYGVRTSRGHIVIDFETPENEIRQYSDIADVINEFID